MKNGKPVEIKRSVFVTAQEIIDQDPQSTRTDFSKKDKLVTRYLFGFFDSTIELPSSAHVEFKPANKDLNKRWEVRLGGDTYIYCDFSLMPKLNTAMEARVEVKVKKVYDPLAKEGNQIVKYVYLNALPLYAGQKPEYKVVVDNNTDTSAVGFHIGGADGKKRNILHLNKL